MGGRPPIKKLVKCEELLRLSYGQPRHGNKANPLDEVFYIILSRKTTARNFAAAYKALRSWCSSWQDLVDMPVPAIRRLIGGAGLGNQRAREIKYIAARLREDFGKVTMAPLKRLETREAEEYLLSLPGVGRKTARCVLMYSLARPVFPVDVHCFRVLSRMGIINFRPPIRAHEDEIQALIPEPLRYSLHVTLVALGRDACRPRNPECHRCPILSQCRHGQTTKCGKSARQG
jgi:endonuclease-3